jgi:hypothetical protein
VTEPDPEFRGALRDLIPDYTGPSDPMPQIAARVRRRRARRRTLIAVGGSGLAVVLALLAPVLLLPSPAGLPAAYPGESAPPIPPQSGPQPAARPDPPVYPVASGVIDGMSWAIGSTSVSAGARRCLRSDGAAFVRDTVCFDDWSAGAPVTWAVLPVTGERGTVTSIAGVSPGPAVRIRLSDGSARFVPAKRTATDRVARFFGVVLAGSVTVRDVTVLDATGHPIGAPVGDPGSPCRPGPSVGCAAPVPTPATEPVPSTAATEPVPSTATAPTPGG